jgi:hypothetical protein
MKDIISRIIVCVLGAGLIFFLGTLAHRSYEKRADISRDWVKTVGTLLHSHGGRNSYTEFDYVFNGVPYREMSYYGNVEAFYANEMGKYIIKVNPQNPKQYAVLQSRPVFTDEDITGAVPGKIMSFYEGHGLAFEYYVDGEMYEHSQEIPIEDSIKYNNLTEGQCYNVRYDVKYPKRAIIYIDEPMLCGK